MQNGTGSTHNARYEALIRISRTTSSPQEPEELYRLLAQEIRGIVGFAFVAVGVYDASAHSISMHVLEECSPPLPVMHLTPEETLTYEVYRSQSPLVIPRLEEEVRFQKLVRGIRSYGIKSLCVLPLTTAQRRVGGIAFGSSCECAYPEDEVEFLSLIANQVAGVIDNTLHSEASRLAQARLKILLDLNRCAGSNTDVAGLLNAVCAAVRTGMRCCLCGVLTPDAESGQLQVAALDSEEGGLRAGTLGPLPASCADEVFRTGKPVLTTAWAVPGPTYLFPLPGSTRALGVLFVGLTHTEQFQEDLDFLSQVGAQIAISLENALARQQVQRSEMLLVEKKRLFPTGSWTWNPATGACSWSQESFRLLGYDPEAVTPSLGLFFERVHPQDRKVLVTMMDLAVQVKRGSDVEFRIVLPDGTLRYLRGVGDGIVNESGELVELVGTLVDITERKRAEGELQHTAACLAEGQRLTHTGTWSRSVLEPAFDKWSDEFFRIFGLNPGDIEPSCEAFMRAVHPDDRLLVEEAKAQTVRERCDSVCEFRIVRPGGLIRHIQCRFHPLLDKAGDLVEYMATVMDVTEQNLGCLALEKAVEEIRELQYHLHRETAALRDEISRASMFEEIVGTSPVFQGVLTRVEKVAPTDSTVLITGETGTGKELIAHAIHRGSPRAGRAFISVNCAALPSSLIASELFGHEKGSFTGAVQRRLGRFELADGGTIFLDEIGDLPAEAQVILLRVLQERKFERIGGNQSIAVDVRVVVSTNRDLRAAIAVGAFRADLFYRLNVVPIEMPALRDRRQDIPILADYFFRHYAAMWGKGIRRIASRTMKLFESYDWPGNVRELQNVIERSVVLCSEETLIADERWLCNSLEPKAEMAGSLNQALLEQERRLIEGALAVSKGRVSGPTGAATRLGIPQSTLAWRIKLLGIRKEQFKVEN